MACKRQLRKALAEFLVANEGQFTLAKSFFTPQKKSFKLENLNLRKKQLRKLMRQQKNRGLVTQELDYVNDEIK